VQRGERNLGVVNLYVPESVQLSAETGEFLEGLLAELALAVETVRLRSQELKTLRQIQLVRNPRMDLPSLMANLLENARQALEVDYALVLLRSSGRNAARLVYGNDLADQLESEQVRELLERTLESGEEFSLIHDDPARLPAGIASILAVPVKLPGQKPFGVFAVAHARPHAFHPREMRVLETITKQAALLIENDRLVNEIEYHAVIEERARLAREIHDGLAQTLAFLKLQTAQLQNSLNRGDLKRSREIIRTNHETLSMAYLDARQAIDNLRVAPEADGQHWLEQSVSDFQIATGLEVDLSINAGDAEFLPEVQAQLIRVAQEALNNVRKHAHATRVEVTLRAWQQDWIWEITDNGCGFSADDIPVLSQYGLRGMRERAEMIGADFQIISQPERGTTVRLRIPNPLEETPV
jgi:two-component system nitrate/nitrite sensor histidine kinase NarX